MSKQVYLHVGCHRGGSTSFQMCLAQNGAALAGLGYDVAYPKRGGLPGGKLAVRLPKPKEDATSAKAKTDWTARHIARLSPDPARPLILSEELIIGRMMHLYRGKFYPGAPKRIGAMRAALGVAPLHVVLILRAYPDLFVSAYRKHLEARVLAPFAQLVPAMVAMTRGWPDLVADLRAALEPRQLTVVEYGARGSNLDLLTRLVPPLQGAPLIEPERALNQAATDAALAELQRRVSAGQTLSPEERQEVVTEYAGDQSDLGLTGFSPPDRAALQARYARDLTAIAAMEGVDLIQA